MNLACPILAGGRREGFGTSSPPTSSRGVSSECPAVLHATASGPCPDWRRRDNGAAAPPDPAAHVRGLEDRPCVGGSLSARISPSTPPARVTWSGASLPGTR